METPAFKINLTIVPPFSPKDVDLCHISPHLPLCTKCDLVFVFKNSKKQSYKVRDVSLDGVKDQLSSLAIKYTESPVWSLLESKTGDDPQSGGSGNGEGSDGDGGDGGDGTDDGVDDGGPPRRKKRKVAEDSTAAIIRSSGETELAIAGAAEI